MGWWSYDIMGGDSPADVEIYFDDMVSRFGAKNITPQHALTLIEETQKEWRCSEDVITQAVGFCMIDRGYPFSEELRKEVIEAIDADEYERFTDVEERQRKLAEFKAIVIAYPNEGKETTMPHQSGLFEEIAKSMVNKESGLINK